MPEQASPQGVIENAMAVLDAKGGISSLNPAAEAWLGVEAGAVAGKPFRELLAGVSPECAASFSELVQDSSAFAHQRVRLKKGAPGNWVSLDVARNDSGFFVRVSSCLPPTEELAEMGCLEGRGSPGEQRHLFVRLLRAENQLDNLTRRWPGVIFSQRADFSLTYASPRLLQLTGVDPDGFRKAPQKFWQVVHEADAEELRRQCRLATKTAGGVSTSFRVRNVQTSQVSYVLEHREAVVSQSGLVLGYECLWVDITRQTIAEKRLSSAAWKDTLATITMGLAHDFGNIMAGILSLSELFRAQTDASHPFHEGLGLIKQQSLEASQLIQRIVRLHRCQTGERNYHNLNDVITELVELVKKVLPRRISVQTELASGELPVYMDGVEFRQVLLNLALNAGDAMPERGTLKIRVSRHTELPQDVHLHGNIPRFPCVCVAVEDSGCGIPERILPFLFDPFFTTKPINKGSGLGLYNCRLFVEGHAGGISVKSVEGKGATFCLWLPEADFSERERIETTRTTRHSLLLVGRPGCLIDSTAEFLRSHGIYVVVTSALAHLRELLGEAPKLDAVMVLADPADAELIALLPELPKLNSSTRLIVQVVGANLDQIPAENLRGFGLVLTIDVNETEFLRRIKRLLSEDPDP